MRRLLKDVPSNMGSPSDLDPVLAAIDRAPGGEPFPPDVRAELDRTMANIAAGRVQLVAHDRA